MFISGFEWQRAPAIDTRSEIITIRGYENPPSKPILFIAGNGVTLEQAAVAFPLRSGADGDFDRPVKDGVFYSPWKVVAWSMELWRDIDIIAAVGSAKEAYQRTMASITVADAEAAVRKLNRKKAARFPLTMLTNLIKKQKVTELRKLLEQHGEGASGLRKKQLVARVVALTAKTAGIETAEPAA